MSMAQQSAAHPARVEASCCFPHSSLSPARRTEQARALAAAAPHSPTPNAHAQLPCDFRRARPGVAACTSSQCQLPIRLRQRVQLWSGDDATLTRARERDSPASFTFPRLGAAARMSRDSVSPYNGNERERAKPSRKYGSNTT